MRHRLPATLPAFVEYELGKFVCQQSATAAEWRAAKKVRRDRDVAQVVRIADAIGIPDEVVLLPRLRALSDVKVVVLKRPRGSR